MDSKQEGILIPDAWRIDATYVSDGSPLFGVLLRFTGHCVRIP